MTVNYDNYVYHFGIPSLLLFLNFSIFEFRLITLIWKNQNTRHASETRQLRRKLFGFFAILYFTMFISLFFVMKFIFVKQYIFIGICFTWLPQIFFNIVTKNRMSMPLLNVFLYSLNKMFLPVINYFNLKIYL